MKPGRKPIPRYERIRQGLPVCASDNGCPREPVRKGLCRPCYDAAGPEVRTPGRKFYREANLGGPCAHWQLKVPTALAGQVAKRAEEEHISAAELARRAMQHYLIAMALVGEPQTPASSGS